jgi:hypothetical protein
MTPIVSSIPQNTVAYIGGSNNDIRAYVLWKDGQMLVIQAATFVSLSRILDPDEPPPEDWQKCRQEHFYGLEVIASFLVFISYGPPQLTYSQHSLLPTIKFGMTNWAYLVRNSSGGYCIKQKNKSVRKILAPTWAPLVDESEITFTTWWRCEHRLGTWKGREVGMLISTTITIYVSFDEDVPQNY